MGCICRVPLTLTKLHPHLLLHFGLPFVSFITCFWDQQFAVWTILEKWLQNFCEIWGAPNFILFLGCMHIICTMTPTSTNFFSQIVFLSSIHPTNAFPSCNAYAGFPHTNQITLPPPPPPFATSLWATIRFLYNLLLRSAIAVWTILEKWLQDFCEIWGAPNFILFLGLSSHFFANISFITCFWDHQWSVNILEKWLQDIVRFGKEPLIWNTLFFNHKFCITVLAVAVTTCTFICKDI